MEKGKKNADAKVGNEASSPRAGALQSALSVELHTHYAIRLWEGRKQSDSNSRSLHEKNGLKSLVCQRPFSVPGWLPGIQQQITLMLIWYW